MDVKGFKTKLAEGFKSYKYALLVLVIGLALMIIPTNAQVKTELTSDVSDVTISEDTLESKLADILSHVEGAGQVQVILSVATGQEIIYQTDENQSSNGDSNNLNTSTVTITDSDRNQSGLIRQENPAVYQGAIIVCEGADNPSVKLTLIDAVSKITGLGTNCIAVLKMK